MATPTTHNHLEERVASWHPVWAVLTIAVGGFVVLSVGFTGIGLMVTHLLHGLDRWDESVNRWFANHRSSVVTPGTGWATRSANTLGIVVPLAVAVLVLLRLRRRASALFMCLALALEIATFLTVNSLVGRPRPDVERLGSLPSTSSFPSGHTAATVALYGGLALLVNEHVRRRAVTVLTWVVVTIAAALVGLSRVYRGMHHPTDVLAGALIGVSVLMIAASAVRLGEIALARRRALVAPASTAVTP